MKMTETDLLRFLQTEESNADTWDEKTRQDRVKSVRSYLRRPYGTEQDGRSQVVASDVFDAVEGMLPDLVDMFVSSDKAVVFDPEGPEDEEAAEQVTKACNHVFYRQNNGFLTLYQAGKDALMLRTGGVKWWWEEKRTPEWTTYRAVSEMQLAAHLTANPDAEVVSRDEYTPSEEEMQKAQAAGIEVPPLYTVRLKTVKKKGRVRVEAIPPDEIQISRRHTSLLMDECLYVAHVCERSLSDIRELGFRVSIEDIKASRSDSAESDLEALRDQYGDNWRDRNDLDEASMLGWLREEYVLLDFDGDGIAERRRIVRLGNRILENVEVSHVPLAIWTPYILTHRWEGLSVADLVDDFQRIRTEIWRAQLDNLDLANNQETVVTVNSQGEPQADIDDLLNRRPGGIIREKIQGAVRPYVERWQGIEAMPMLESLEVAKENRTGFTRYSSGLDSDSLNKTATGVTKIMNASQKRMKLMARIMAEALVAPMFRGIFKTLSDYCMEKLSMKLTNGFVQYDPQEWRDAYNMSINVGIGTGDTFQQQQMLMQLAGVQFTLLQSPLARLVDPQNVYNLHARLVESAGFKNPSEFLTDPKTLPPPQPMPPDPKMQIEQAKLMLDWQKFQAERQQDVYRFQAETQSQMAVDQNRQEWEARQKALESQQQAELEALRMQDAERERLERMAFDKWKAELDAQVKLAIADKPGNEVAPLKQQLGKLIQYVSSPPKIVRDEQGNAIGVEKGGRVYQVQRDEQGRAVSLQ